MQKHATSKIDINMTKKKAKKWHGRVIKWAKLPNFVVK